VKRHLLLAVIIGLLLTANVAAVSGATDSPNARPDDAAAAPDGTSGINTLQFANAAQVFTYRVQASGGTRLQVDTKDCCIAGDSWGVAIIDPQVTPPKVVPKCGTGSTTKFTGRATRGSATVPFTGTANVMVFYCRGVDVFPAEMDVRFVYNGNFTVTNTTFNPPG
jgi:hypothetical protein